MAISFEIGHEIANLANPVYTEKRLKPQLKQLHFPHEAGHVICCNYETRHTVYYVIVRSHTSYSSTNENQIYLTVPTEQRRIVVERTRRILQAQCS